MSWTRTTLAIPGMDCPSDERLIRLALAELGDDVHLEFDLGERRLVVEHRIRPEEILERLEPLGLGTRLAASEPISEPTNTEPVDEGEERRTLWWLLGLNGTMFVVELAAGWWAESTGLMSDGLDMLADAAVYALSLYAVGRGAASQRRAAHTSGWLQMALALGAYEEVIRRFLTGSDPQTRWMIAISLLAFAVNVASLLRIARHRHGGAHMKASWIFSANDVLANVGVMIAGALVAWTGSRWPDLLIGSVIATVVGIGAVRILRLR